MLSQFIFLCIQTLLCWFLVFFIYRQKKSFTLIPLYSYLAVLTILTHHLSNLGFAVVFGQWYFLISSFSFFTSLMLVILFIYLFEGPRAVRLALRVILFTSFFYIGVIFLINQQVDSTNFVILSWTNLFNTLWSIFVITIDIFFMTIFWQLLSKIPRLQLLFQTFYVIIATFFLDSIIYVVGVYSQQPNFYSVLTGSLSVRLILSLVITPIATYYLKHEKYQETNTKNQKSLWEIFNFKSDLEVKIKSMEEMIEQEKKLQEKLNAIQETYSLAVEGSSAGIWDWDIINDKITYSLKFCQLLGHKFIDLPTDLESFKKIIHPDDLQRTLALLEKSHRDKKIFSIEYRLKNLDGNYKWYLSGGITKYNDDDKPIRMVGSIIDIDEKQKLSQITDEKVASLERLNKFMVGREIQMIKLKQKIKKLEAN